RAIPATRALLFRPAVCPPVRHRSASRALASRAPTGGGIRTRPSPGLWLHSGGRVPGTARVRGLRAIGEPRRGPLREQPSALPPAEPTPDHRAPSSHRWRGRDISDLSLDIRAAFLGRRVIATLGCIVPLNDQGLRPSVIPLVGIEIPFVTLPPTTL